MYFRHPTDPLALGCAPPGGGGGGGHVTLLRSPLHHNMRGEQQTGRSSSDLDILSVSDTQNMIMTGTEIAYDSRQLHLLVHDDLHGLTDCQKWCVCTSIGIRM